MEVLRIPSTQRQAPDVLLDPESGILLFSGQCYLDNAEKFFRPISEWFQEFLKQPGMEICFEMRLDYFNTSSAKCIWELLLKLERYQNNLGGRVSVAWHFPKDDENTWEIFDDFKAEVNLPFIHIDTGDQ